MQIYALEKNRLIAAPYAERKKDYLCPECRGEVRVKGGDIRQSHFFHLKSTKSCKLSQKGLIHLRIQKFICYLFDEEAEMEKTFPTIGRIADVACPISKKIYEIQYSPITLEEAKQRCEDYESLGYTIIWILHDHTFKQEKIGAAERYLRTKTCYYTDMDEEGKGHIYDVLDSVRGKSREELYEFYEIVNLRKCSPTPKCSWPLEIEARGNAWPLYHEGDYLDLALKKKLPRPESTASFTKELKEWYMGALHMLLERSCK